MYLEEEIVETAEATSSTKSDENNVATPSGSSENWEAEVSKLLDENTELTHKEIAAVVGQPFMKVKKFVQAEKKKRESGILYDLEYINF